MIKKDQKINYRYDALADALAIYVIGVSPYEKVVELEPNIILAIGEDSYLLNLRFWMLLKCWM